MVEPQLARVETFPIANFDLLEEIRRMRASPISHGHVAKTVVRNRDLRVVLIVVKRGARLPRHRVSGSQVIHVVDGRVVVTLLSSAFDLGPGRMLVIEPDIEHALVAIDDSALMLTVTHRHAERPERARLGATDAREHHSTIVPATAAEIVGLLGEVEPLTLDQLLATGATISEVAAAMNAIEDEDAFGESNHAPRSPREAEVRAILEQVVFENAEEWETEREIAKT